MAEARRRSFHEKMPHWIIQFVVNLPSCSADMGQHLKKGQSRACHFNGNVSSAPRLSHSQSRIAAMAWYPHHAIMAPVSWGSIHLCSTLGPQTSTEESHAVVPASVDELETDIGPTLDHGFCWLPCIQCIDEIKRGCVRWYFNRYRTLWSAI